MGACITKSGLMLGHASLHGLLRILVLSWGCLTLYLLPIDSIIQTSQTAENDKCAHLIIGMKIIHILEAPKKQTNPQTFSEVASMQQSHNCNISIKLTIRIRLTSKYLFQS
jgi:hypothetical protein